MTHKAIPSALLLHIAAAEVGYQAHTFYARDLSKEEGDEWGAALDLGEKARHQIRGHELDYYLSKLAQVRAKTLSELSRCDEQWLEAETSFGSGQKVNYPRIADLLSLISATHCDCDAS